MLFEMCKCYFPFNALDQICFCIKKYIRTFLLFITKHMEILSFHKFEQIEQSI